MATTPPTSISGSYQRLGGSTPVITQGTPGPQISPATRQRLAFEEANKLDVARREAEKREEARKIEAAQKAQAAKQEEMARARFGLKPGQAMTPYQQGRMSADQDAQRKKDEAANMEGFKMGNWANRR